MKQEELTMLRYRHAGLKESLNTSNGQRADSTTILELLDQIEFYQHEIERLIVWASDSHVTELAAKVTKLEAALRLWTDRE